MMSEAPSDPKDPNSLEVELSPDSWKTEFHDEIKSVKLNGEKIAEIHDLMQEMKAIKATNDRAIKGLSIAIVILSVLGLSILGYGMSYLMRFKVDKLDELVDAGIDRLDTTNKIFVPLEAIAQLNAKSSLMHAIVWDRKYERWFVIKPSGAKRTLMDHFLLPRTAYYELRDFGFSFHKNKWSAPADFPLPVKNTP